jgi:uncharacterized lipoprotein
MKNIILVCLAVSFLSGCGWISRGSAYVSGYTKHCVEGVMYYQFPSGVTVAYEQNGKVKVCK